jgi:hypothetical protein
LSAGARHDAGAPRLTCALVVGPLRERGSRALAALLAQTALDEMEIVVVDVAVGGAPLAGADHAQVRWLARPETASFGAAQAECIRQARAPLVALIEDHCYAEPGWAAGVLEAFRQPVAIVSYAMSNADATRWVSRAFLMCEYGRWMHPARAGFIPIAACNNVAYRISALEPYPADLDLLLDGPHVLHQAIQRRGGRAWLAADAIVAHESWTRLSQGLHANAALKRILAHERVRHGRWSLGRRVAYGLGMALAPPLEVWRLARSVAPRPALWWPFVESLPIALLAYASNAVAEARGYLFGPGESRDILAATELERPRGR